MEYFDDKVLKIYELGYRDAQREQDYDPQGHEETYALQQDISKIQQDIKIQKDAILDEIEECKCMGEISKLLRQYGRW